MHLFRTTKIISYQTFLLPKRIIHIALLNLKCSTGVRKTSKLITVHCIAVPEEAAQAMLPFILAEMIL